MKKQQSLFSWLQRSPENQSKPLFGSPSAAENTSFSSVGPLKALPLDSKLPKNVSKQKAKKVMGSPPITSIFKSPLKTDENVQQKQPFTPKGCDSSRKSAPASKLLVVVPDDDNDHDTENVAPNQTTAKITLSGMLSEKASRDLNSPVKLPDAIESDGGNISSDSDNDFRTDIRSAPSLWNKLVSTNKASAAAVDVEKAGLLRIPMPIVRQIDCPAALSKNRIPDVLLVTEFLQNFSCIIQKKKPLDPTPGFHLLLDALGKPTHHDSLYLCGIVFHLVSFMSKQTLFTKVRYLGQPLSELDLSVQSSPEILRIFLANLPINLRIPRLSDDLFGKWTAKGFFSLSPNEKLDILVTSVNWLVGTPAVIDYLASKEEAMHHVRSDLFRLRKEVKKQVSLCKETEAERAAELLHEIYMIENKEPEVEDEPIFLRRSKRGTVAPPPAKVHVETPAEKLLRLNEEVAEMKLAVEKAEQQYDHLRCLQPLGTDRSKLSYWQFETFSAGDTFVCVENAAQTPSDWGYFTKKDVYEVISHMQSNPFAADFNLRMALEAAIKKSNTQENEEDSDKDLMDEDVDISAGAIDYVIDNLLDSEARIHAAAFADKLPDAENWRGKIAAHFIDVEEKGKCLAECLLTLANAVHLRVVVPRAKASSEPRAAAHKQEEEASSRETTPSFISPNSNFAKWKEEVVKTVSASRLLVLLDIFLSWLNWSMSAEHARCKRCRRGPNSGMLIICDKCNRGFHLKCLDPPLTDAPGGSWFCYDCSKSKQKEADEKVDSNSRSSSEDSEHEYEDYDEDEFREPDKECFVCSEPESSGMELISCSICLHSFHLDCLKPPLRYPPRGTWNCSKCMSSKSRRRRRVVVCESPPSPKPVRSKKKSSSGHAVRSQRVRDIPSRASTSCSSRSCTPADLATELSQRYSFRPRSKKY